MLGEKLRGIFKGVSPKSVSTEAARVRARVDQLNAEYPGKLTTRKRIQHGVKAWGEHGVVFPAEMEKGS